MIPYRSFPAIDLGPLSVNTFGLAMATGVIVGFRLLRLHADGNGLDANRVAQLATRLVVAGVLGARAAFVLTHIGDFVDRPWAVMAVWEGGLQFFGGLVLGLVVLRHWLRANGDVDPWVLADGIAYGLAAGMVAGRVGCYAVGEHLGGATGFPLATRYLGGRTIEGPLAVGTGVHNTALYEAFGLLALVGVLTWLRRRPIPPGVLLLVVGTWYGVQRFGTDFLRTYDREMLGLTTAQFVCIALLGAMVWLTARVIQQGAPLPGSDSSNGRRSSNVES